MNRIIEDAVCDTTEDDSSTEASFISIKFVLIEPLDFR